MAFACLPITILMVVYLGNDDTPKNDRHEINKGERFIVVPNTCSTPGMYMMNAASAAPVKTQ